MGKSAGSNFGYSVANAGDLNLDGYPGTVGYCFLLNRQIKILRFKLI